jgi:molybdopterin-biosynthesis enzyme MoeA-like protein
MKAEIIAIGSELLLGQLVDTNSSFIAKRLAENGIELIQTSTVGDDLPRMKEVIREAITRSQVVITTVASAPQKTISPRSHCRSFQRPLTFQPHLMEQIETLFKKQGFEWLRTIGNRPISQKDPFLSKTPKEQPLGLLWNTLMVRSSPSLGFPLRWNI